MKKTFRQKIIIPWYSVGVFLPLAMAWHLPLFFLTNPEGIEQKALGPIGENPYITLQPSLFPSVKNQSWMDPTVYILPSEVGFSAHIRQMPISSKITIENPLPLVITQSFQTKRWGNELSTIEALSLLQPLPEEMVIIDFKNESTTETTLKATPLWRITGNIANRLLPTHSVLPTITSSEPIGTTMLRIGVAPQGDVQFVVLEQSSGLDKSDEAAIRFVKSLCFNPLYTETDGSTSWGMVKFLWPVEQQAKKP